MIRLSRTYHKAWLAAEFVRAVKKKPAAYIRPMAALAPVTQRVSKEGLRRLATHSLPHDHDLICAAYGSADGVSLCSTADERRLLAAIPGAHTVVVPNAADVDFYQPSTEALHSHSMDAPSLLDARFIKW